MNLHYKLNSCYVFILALSLVRVEQYSMPMQ